VVALLAATDVPTYCPGSDRSALPGAGRFAPASAITRTQSFASGGVKFWVPDVAKVPISVVAPLLGLNHQRRALLLALVIMAMLLVIVVAFP